MDEGVCLAASAFIAVVHFYVTGLLEDFCDGLWFVYGYHLYEFAIDTLVGIVRLFETDLVAF